MTEAEKLEFEIMEKAQQLAALRRDEVGVDVPAYAFQTLYGETSLAELFAGRETQWHRDVHSMRSDFD